MEESPELVCEICLKPQSSTAGLKQHIRRIHKKIPLVPIQCNQCEKILRDEHTLKCHMKAVHGSKNLACPYESCPKTFSQAGILNAHLKTHSEEKVYSCDFCGLNYKDRGYYQKHLNVHHNGKKPYECEVCGKSYIQSSHLKDHMTLHTGEKRFKCEECNKYFRLSKSYKEHLNSHNGLKPYKCSTCSFTTSYRKNLNAHEKKHYPNFTENGVTSISTLFKCNKCELDCKSEDDLIKHERIHDKDYFCEFCQEDFDHSEQLNEHLRVCKAQCQNDAQNTFDKAEATTIDMYNDEQKAPVIILVNIPQEENQDHHSTSGLESFDISSCEVHSVVEIPCDIQTGEVSENEVSPLSILLSAAASESGASVRFGQSHKFDLPEEASRPLDLSVSTQVSKNPESDILEFTSVNSGRRRSVFLVEELDYEHQGEMTVVDPLKVTGVNKEM
eukprot:GFUD01016833.1.p1 GENE.GFUD01016833.1~~GFUD01016833.1.p1  ORF type:complete len:444 (+),score=79.68 GFUD01016833.1:295-1626(+)